MISIEFQNSKEPNKPTICPLRQAVVRRSFLLWVGKYNPDFVSRRVLSLLTEKYASGDKDALFGKMKQLEESEHYELCAMFKNMFDSMNLNKEYLRWAKNYA